MKKIILLIIIALAAVFLYPKVKQLSFFNNAAVKNLSIEEKMKLADEYLEEYERNGRALCNTLAEFKSSSQDLSKEVKKYNQIAQRFTKRLNALKLPCPQTSATHNDPTLRAYLSWARTFEEKNKRVMNDLQQELNESLQQ